MLPIFLPRLRLGLTSSDLTNRRPLHVPPLPLHFLPFLANRSSAPAASGKGNHEKDAPVTHSRPAGRRFRRLPRRCKNSTTYVRFLSLFLLARSSIIRPRPFGIFPAARFRSNCMEPQPSPFTKVSPLFFLLLCSYVLIYWYMLISRVIHPVLIYTAAVSHGELNLIIRNYCSLVSHSDLALQHSTVVILNSSCVPKTMLQFTHFSMNTLL